VIEENEIFIFFSFSPSYNLLNFISMIRATNKKIVMIQDTHQFSLHQGSANSSLVKPDLFFAASDQEEQFISDSNLLPSCSISSRGWLFQNEFDEYLATKPIKPQKNILIAFSAPAHLTISSRETLAKRLVVFNWVASSFPEYKILIKLHPHENQDFFMSHFSKKNFKFHLLPIQSSIISAIQISEIIVSSNETQIPLDVICHDDQKQIFLYSYQKKNFLKDKTSTLFTDQINNVEIGLLDYPSRQEIFKTYLKYDKDMHKNFLQDIYSINQKTNRDDILIGIYLWLFIYQKKSAILDFIKFKKLDKYTNLYNLLLNKEFDLELLNESFQDQSIRDPLFIIVIRNAISNNISSRKYINYVNQYFAKEYLLSFFLKDTQRFKNFLASHNLNTNFQRDYDNLLNNLHSLYILKSKFSAILFSLLAIIYSLKIPWISMITFKISDRIFKY